MTSSFVNDDVRFITNVSKTKKKIGKKLITTTEKTYTLEDGSEEVVTLEETTTVA